MRLRGLLAIALCVGASTAQAEPRLFPPWRHGIAAISDVASSVEPTNKVDFRFTVSYLHLAERGDIKRERVGVLTGQDSILTTRDLAFSHDRDELSLRAEIGLYHDLSVYAELPLVLYDQTEYRYDQSASPCTYPPAPAPSCISAANSSTVNDRIVGPDGYDAQAFGAATSGSLLLRGARRGAAGGTGGNLFDTVRFGLAWAPLSPRRDPALPMWMIAVEPQISIGTIRAFDRTAPAANHGVSDGIHRILFRTAISKRLGHFEPYVGLHYLFPFARSGSAFVDDGPGQAIKDPQHQAGGVLGTEIIAYERGRPDWRVVFDVSGRIEGHFLGRGYSEAWELFAGSPVLEGQGRSYSGLTVIDGYATVGLELALDAQLSRWFRLRAGFAYARDQSHLITGDESGKDGVVNPAYRPIIDQPGQRYLVDDVDRFVGRVSAQLRF